MKSSACPRVDLKYLTRNGVLLIFVVQLLGQGLGGLFAAEVMLQVSWFFPLLGLSYPNPP